MRGRNSLISGTIMPFSSAFRIHPCIIWILNVPSPSLEGKIVELRKLAEDDPTMDIGGDVARLNARAEQLVRETYAHLTPWQKVLVARHPDARIFSTMPK